MSLKIASLQHWAKNMLEMFVTEPSVHLTKLNFDST